jgi:hypothetical protein
MYLLIQTICLSLTFKRYIFALYNNAMKKNLLFFILCLFNYALVNAQQVFKGPGTSNSTFLFGYTSYAAKSQCIFWPSDFTNLTDGDIIRVYYHYGSGTGDQVLTRFSIEMGQTIDNSYTANNFFTGLTPVFYRNSYTIPQGVSGNWFSIDLDTPFTYDSTKTLIVQLIFPESAIDSWGTLGTSNTPVKKIISPDTLATIGDPSSGTWQDFGFDIATPAGTKTFLSNQAGFDFMISPNPASNKIDIKSVNTFSNQFQLSITNSLGQIIFTKQLNSNSESIDLTSFQSGIYFVQLQEQNGNIKSKKFIVEN